MHRYENHLFNGAGSLDGQEEDLIIEMVKILRNHTKKEKKAMEELEKDIRRFVGLANPFKNRYMLFTRCKIFFFIMVLTLYCFIFFFAFVFFDI